MSMVKFSTAISPRTKKAIDRLQEKTGITKNRLTEMAFKLLEEYYSKLGTVYDKAVVDNAFKEMVNFTFTKLDSTLKKLAE